jgi:hypothetical protein
MADEETLSFRAASLQTIAIVHRTLGADASCCDREEALEEAYPFWVENGIARRIWRGQVRDYLKQHGCRPRPRHRNGGDERIDEHRLRMRVRHGG